jgi:histidyl-tRNA synthetase
LTPEQVVRIKQFVDVVGDQEEVLNRVERLMAISRLAMEGVEELRGVIDMIRDYGVPDSAWKIDLSIARGLDYYTGPIFETQLTDLPSIGSVFSGGRYDKLVGKFCGEDVPAVGASVGVDRLLEAIEKLGLQTAASSPVQALVLTFDQSTMSTCRRVAGNLRRAGIRTELYCGSERSLKRQIGAASDRKIPYVVIIGDDEAARGIVQLKNMATREQQELSEEQLPSVLASSK